METEKSRSNELASAATTTPAAVSPVTLHRQSMQLGAFEFIPIPFLDEWFILRERKSLVRKILKRRGIEYEKGVPKLLSNGGAKSLFTRVKGWAGSLIMKPLRKACKGILFWLTVRKAVLTVVETYFLARFAHFSELDRGRPISREEAGRWGKEFTQTMAKLDQRFAKEGIRKLWKSISRSKEEQGEGLSRQEVEEELEREAPGILAEFDLRMREAVTRG